jgi:hypothetical protein
MLNRTNVLALPLAFFIVLLALAVVKATHPYSDQAMPQELR